MRSEAFLIQAVSPLHAGTGQAAEIIDLPIARMKATGIPFVPGSSIKGVLRQARREGPAALDPERLAAVFGPDSASSDVARHAGAVSIGDARLLLLPVRSFHGTFAFVTSPLLLELARRDIGCDLGIPRPAAGQACVPSAASAVVAPQRGGAGPQGPGRIYLQEIDRDAVADAATAAWAGHLAPRLATGGDRGDWITSRLAVVDDDTMTFLAETGTQIDARVRIDDNTRTASDTALWMEESLPPETVLVGVAIADRSRHGTVHGDPAAMLAEALPAEPCVIQIGGKATVGRGLCRLVRLPRGGTP